MPDLNATPSMPSSRKPTIEAPPLRVSFPSEATHVTKLDLQFDAGRLYTAWFSPSQTLRSLSIHVLMDRDLAAGALLGLGLSEPDSDGKVAEILKPHFPNIDIAFLRKRSRTPTMVGALVHGEISEILLCFRIFRGALCSQELPNELLRSVRIEAFPLVQTGKHR
jgi:hypothetical protein